jgi:hypothetical protein
MNIGKPWKTDKVKKITNPRQKGMDGVDLALNLSELFYTLRPVPG